MTATAVSLDEKVRQARRLAPTNLAAHAWLIHRDDRDQRILAAAHHQVIAAVLQDPKQFPYVVIVCPPGYAKSTWGSIIYPAWRLGATNGRLRMGLISNTATQAEGFARAVQQVMEGDGFRETYPGAIRDPRRKWTNREMFFRDTPQGANPALMAMGMDGPILGKRFDEIIIDDPTTWPQARSETIMEEQRSKLLNTVVQRFPAGARPPHGDGSTRMVVLLTRYGPRDLVPTFQQLGFYVLTMPALGFWDRLVTCGECGARAVGRVPPCAHPWTDHEVEWGQAALWPEKEPRASLEAAREHDPLTFELVYQANPQVLSGDVFDSSWFRYAEEIPRRFDVIAIGVDTAGGRDRKHGDYVAIVTIGQRGDEFWVLDAWRDRVPAPVQQDRVVQKAAELEERGLRPDIVAIEDANEGRALYDYLVRDTRLPVKAVPPRGDKEFRAIPLSNAYRSGRVWHFAERWVRPLEAELEAFPESEHDDLVDALGLAYSQTGGAAAGPRLRVLG